jgi:protein-S-isoprenylcysteine O-methyltransferase Ste14
MHAPLHLLAIAGIATCWAAFAVTWLAGAMYNTSRGPADRTRTSSGSVLLFGAISIWVIFRVVPPPDWQALALQAPWVRVTGMAILLGSTVFTLWARLALGTMWSAAPTVKHEHQLRTGGAYGITRHPIYTGILGMLLGTTLAAGTGRWILLVPVGLLFYQIKIHAEERLLLAAFPDDYRRYRRQVPQLIPGLRRIRRRGTD